MNVWNRKNPLSSILKQLVLVGFAFAAASTYAASGITLTSETVNGSPHIGSIQATPGDLLETSLTSISQNTPADPSRHVAASVYDGQISTAIDNVAMPSTQAGYWGSATPGAHFIEFNLNTNAAPLGYTISSIKVIQNGDSWRPKQAWKVYFKPVGSSTFNAFYTLPATGVVSKVNQVVLADTTAAPLTNSVAALRFEFSDSGANSGWTWYREIDVIGTVTGDSTPPSITTLSPADNATSANTISNLVVTFNELIAIGTGNIILTNLTDATSTTIAVTDASQVSVLGSRLTINPTANLTVGNNYAIWIAATAIKDLSGIAFPGIADDVTWNFTADGTPPSVVTLIPSDNSTAFNVASNLMVTFNEAIAIGTGNITLTNLTDGTSTTIAITDASQVSVAGAILTINPTALLAANKNYAIQISATAIKDLSNNAFSGITGDTTWNFVSSGLMVTLTSENVNGSPHAGPLIQATPGDLLETSLSSIRESTPVNGSHLASSVYDGQIVPVWGIAGYWGSATPGAHFIEFNLNTNAAPLGYTISSLKVIQGGDSFRPNQAWTLSFKLVGASTFSNFYTLPSTGVASKLNQVVLADVTAVPLTSSVAALRFDFGPTKPGSDWTCYSEIDVIGTAINDSTLPSITTLSPADNATSANTISNLVVTFNELIAIGTGNIILTNLTDATSTTIAITDASQVSVWGSRLTINPTANLAGGKAYAIRIAATAIKDLSGNAFPGIADATTWNFTADGTPPSVVTLIPADNATAVNVASNLVVTFSEPIAIGTGNITLKNLADATSTTIAITDATQVSVAGSVLTIDPTTTLAGGKSYAIQIAATAIKDFSNNAFPGITDDTTWNFAVSNLAVTLTYETANGSPHVGSIQAVTNDLLQTSLSSITQAGAAHGSHVPATVYDGQIVPIWGNAGYWGSATPGAHFIEFNLNTNAARLGYTISSIRVIQGGDSYRPKQNWTVSFKLVGESTFSNFYTLPSTGVASKLNQVVLADVTAVPLGRNIAAVRFDFGPTQPGYDWTCYSEIDVIGKPTPPRGTLISCF